MLKGPSTSYFSVPQRHDPLRLSCMFIACFRRVPATLRPEMVTVSPHYRNGCCSTVGASVEVRVQLKLAETELQGGARITMGQPAINSPRILLIGPYDPHCGEYTFLAPPLGVWRLAGVLKKNGASVRVFD